MDTEGGKPTTVRLFTAAAVPYRPHIKVRGDANPYDPAWKDSFHRRHGRSMARELAGRRRELRLWQDQGGIGLAGAQPLTTIEGWHHHHLVPRSEGGGDEADNRILLHPTWHQHVHHGL